MSKSTHRQQQKQYASPMEQLEGRQLMAASSIKLIGNDLQNLSVSPGSTAKQNANSLILTFSGKINKTVNTSNIRLFAYAADTTTEGAQIKKTIPIVSTSLDSTGTKLTLKTGMMVRKGASLEIKTGAIKDTGGNDVTGKTESKKGLNKARFTLAARAFQVTDKNLFANDVLSGGKTPVSTGNVELDEDTVKGQLDAFLQKKVNQKVITAAQKSAAMTRYSAAATKAIASSPNIRAAVLSLTGTVGEPAIEYYLGTANSTGKTPVALRFDDEFDTGATIIATSFNTSGRLRVILNPSYVGESFIALSGILAKESFQDTKDPTDDDKRRTLIALQELTVTNFVEVAVYGQQLIADSSYAAKGTALTLRENYRLYLAMNSGTNQFPRVGITKAPLLTANAAPGFSTVTKYGASFGSNSIQSFQDDIKAEYTSRNVADKNPWNIQATGRAILAKLTGDTFASGAQFTNDLIKQVDQNQDALGDNDVLKLAKALKVLIK